MGVKVLLTGRIKECVVLIVNEEVVFDVSQVICVL
jgi:hypothetical protein